MDSITFESLPTKTYALNTETGRIAGTVDGAEAVRQAVYLILSTERFSCPIYSWNYGTELRALIGMPMSLCATEVKRRIYEALVQDERITGVGDFEIERKGSALCCTFTVNTIYGNITARKEVTL